MDKKVLTVCEAASILNRSQYKVYKMLHAHILSGYQDVGSNMWKIPESSIANYMTQQLNSQNNK